MEASLFQMKAHTIREAAATVNVRRCILLMWSPVSGTLSSREPFMRACT